MFEVSDHFICNIFSVRLNVVHECMHPNCQFATFNGFTTTTLETVKINTREATNIELWYDSSVV